MGSHLHVVCVCVIVRRVEAKENNVPVTLNHHQPDKMMETLDNGQFKPGLM